MCACGRMYVCVCSNDLNRYTFFKWTMKCITWYSWGRYWTLLSKSFMKPGGSKLHSQGLFNKYYLKPNQSNHHMNISFLKINVDAVLHIQLSFPRGRLANLSLSKALLHSVILRKYPYKLKYFEFNLTDNVRLRYCL